MMDAGALAPLYLRDKVALDFRTGIPNTFSEIEVRLHNGERFSAQHDSGIPAIDLRHQGERLEAKFAALVDPILGTDKTARLITTIARLDDQPTISGLIGGEPCA